MSVIDDIKGRMQTDDVDVTKLYSDLFLSVVFLVLSVVVNRLEQKGVTLSTPEKDEMEKHIRQRLATVAKEVQEELYKKHAGGAN